MFSPFYISFFHYFFLPVSVYSMRQKSCLVYCICYNCITPGYHSTL